MEESRYQQRLRRFVTALNNRKPDMVPIRPFAAEFTGRHAGFDCQQLTQNYPDAFEAMIRCCKDYDWDAVPASMVYVWTGITDAASIAYRDENALLGRSTEPERTYVEQVMPAKLALNLDYVQHFSLGGDLRLLLSTFTHIARDIFARDTNGKL